MVCVYALICVVNVLFDLTDQIKSIHSIWIKSIEKWKNEKMIFSSIFQVSRFEPTRRRVNEDESVAEE